jgi:hypothetical protein
MIFQLFVFFILHFFFQIIVDYSYFYISDLNVLIFQICFFLQYFFINKEQFLRGLFANLHLYSSFLFAIQYFAEFIFLHNSFTLLREHFQIIDS